MKIFINAESLSDQPTGVGLYLENILNIFSSKYSNKNQFILFAKRDSKKLRFFQKNGFKVKILNFNFLNKYIHSIVYYFWISILLYRDKYDVIWFSNPRSAFFFPKSSVVFTTIHDFTYLFQPFTQRLFGFIL